MISDGAGRGDRLVHGIIHPEGESPPVSDMVIPHAWVERRGKVWEPVRDQWMLAETFAALFRPEIGHRYSKKETARLLLKHKHWGTWHDFPPHYWAL